MESLKLPGNIDAEALILGSVMLNGDLFAEVSAALTPSDFSLEVHRRIFHRMNDLAQRGEPIDRVTVASELNRAGQLDSVGGLSYLISLDEHLPEITHLDAYIRMIQDAGILRRAAAGCQELLNNCLSRAAQAPDVLQRIGRLAADLEGCLVEQTSLASPTAILGQASISDLMGDGARKWLPTPWDRLNGMIGGFEPGQMIIIGGRPGSGKSVFLWQCCYDAAALGRKVAMISLEMTNESLIQRYIAANAAIPLHRLRNGSLDQEGRYRAQQALAGICELQELRMAERLFTIPSIRASLTRGAAKRPWDLIAIDYLQLLASGRSRNLVEEISEISRAIKLLAVEFGCPVLIGSQLSRESEKEGREPRLSDLRQCGSLEQDADTVIFPHPLREQDPESPNLRVEFIVAKQRNGRTGRVPATFEKPYVRFV